jgi:hypothetical protein
MRTIFIIISVITVFLVASCETNEITFGNTDIDLTKSAEVRFVYDLPVISSTTQNITRLKYNDNLVSEVSTALGSIFPNSAAKFSVVPQGNVKIDAFTGTTKDVPLYSNNFTAGKGKYTAYLYNVNEPLLVLEDKIFPSSDPWADTLAYIQFVNLLYKADGVTPYGTLFLKGKRGAGTTASPYVYVDIASCDFKQASELIPYKLVKSGTIWSGTETGMVFVVYDSTGNMLKYYPSSTGALTDWSATGFSLGKGRFYVFHMNGKMGANYAAQAIRLSTISLN